MRVWWEEESGKKHDVSVHGEVKGAYIRVYERQNQVQVVAAKTRPIPTGDLARTITIETLVRLVTAAPVALQAAVNAKFLEG